VGSFFILTEGRMKEKILFTSEAVSEGHPDKVSDQIADAILDHCLQLDPLAHVAIECFVAKQKLLIGGEVKFSSPNIKAPNYELIAKKVLTEIGYTRPELEFSVNELTILNWVQTQSADIDRAVSKEEIGAGDQGLMFGFATNETTSRMPLAISIAQRLVQYASELRKKDLFPYARPDMKSQVTIDYSENTPRIETIIMSIQHDESAPIEAFKDFIAQKIIRPVVNEFKLNQDYQALINASGRFVIGGPAGDTGLTGRKIIVDTYGGSSRHGGGSFSGKDPTKVDRSGAYLARYIAVNLVASGMVEKVEVQLAYVIGQASPVSISVFDFGTLHPKINHNQLLKAIKKVFFFKPQEIINQFRLTRPVFAYRDLAAYGHFGRLDLNIPWEKTDKIQALKNELNTI